MKYEIDVIRMEPKKRTVHVEADGDKEAFQKAKEIGENLDFSDVSYGEAIYEYELVSKKDEQIEKFFQIMDECVAITNDAMEFPVFVVVESVDEENTDEMVSDSNGHFCILKSEIKKVTIDQRDICVELNNGTKYFVEPLFQSIDLTKDNRF